MRESAPRGGWFRRRVPFRNTAAFRSARAARCLESRQRGLLIVHHVEARAVSDERAPLVVKSPQRSCLVGVSWSVKHASLSHCHRTPPADMRVSIGAISATASASRLADVVVDASRRRKASGLHRRCRDERTEVRTHRRQIRPAANLIMHAPVCIPD